MIPIGGAGGPALPLLPGLAVPDPTPDFTACYAVRDGHDAVGRAFSCLGSGGNGAVFEVIAKRPALARVPERALAEGMLVAMKQVYKDPDSIAKMEERELRDQIAMLRDRILADASARSTLIITLDGFKSAVDPLTGKQLLRIIMYRAPPAVPFAYSHRPATLDQPIPEFRERNPLAGARADMLDNALCLPGRMTPQQVHYTMRQLLTALAFLHETGRAHRDVKCDNLLLWGTSESPGDGVSAPLAPIARELGGGAPLPWAKLGDFGYTRMIAGDATAHLGTPRNMAPEQVHRNYNTPVDIFAAGCVLYQLFLGADPRDYNAAAVFAERFPLHADPRWELNELTRRLKHAFTAMVNWLPERRPPAAELLARNEYFGV